MTEVEKIAYTKSFIDKLANGINPIDDTPVREDDIVNNVRLSRCFFYVSDILQKIIDNGGISCGSGISPYILSADQLSKFAYSDIPITISDMADRINALMPNKFMPRITHRDISNWLIHIGALCEQKEQNGKNSKRPTQRGYSVGITTENRTSSRGDYVLTVYNRLAQEFIIKNFTAVMELKYRK